MSLNKFSYIGSRVTKVIEDYIHDYNHECISLNLKKLSPVAYRTQLEQAV